MINFDINLVRFEYVKLKSVSTALGGSLRVVDEELSKDAEKDVTKRYVLPFAVARQYQQRNKARGSSYLVPIDACLVWFGDQIVMVERRTYIDHTDSNLVSGRKWISTSEMNFDKYVKPKTTSDRWYTDGSFIYELPENILDVIKDAEYLTQDGLFRGVAVTAMKFADLDMGNLIQNPATRSIVACVPKNGQVILTPPIWKNVLNVRKDVESEQGCKKGRFDLIDDNFHVNLDFALNAGRIVGNVFGYDQIAPLKLDELMIHHKTVNLPKIPKSVRSTFGIGIPYLHAFAWIAGLLAKCDNMSDFMKMRGLLKQLCTKGIFNCSLIDNVFKDKEVGGTPTLVEKDDALSHVEDNIGATKMRDYWIAAKGGPSTLEHEQSVDVSVHNAIGAMVD